MSDGASGGVLVHHRRIGDHADCALVVNGLLMYTTYPPGMPPRLPGNECGCRREGSRDDGWTLYPCSAHSKDAGRPWR